MVPWNLYRRILCLVLERPLKTTRLQTEDPLNAAAEMVPRRAREPTASQPVKVLKINISVPSSKTDSNTMETGMLSPPEVLPLEQDILDEYERLAENMKKVCFPLTSALSPPTPPPSYQFGAKQRGLTTIARIYTRQPRERADDGHTGRAAGAGAQDQPGLHAAQG